MLLIFMSCVQDDDYGTPNISDEEPNITNEQLITFKAIKSLYEQAVNGGNTTAVINDECLY